VKVRDIIKAIQDLNPGDKHRLRACLIDLILLLRPPQQVMC
jgi:hypothetical protein